MSEANTGNRVTNGMQESAKVPNIRIPARHHLTGQEVDQLVQRFRQEYVDLNAFRYSQYDLDRASSEFRQRVIQQSAAVVAMDEARAKRQQEAEKAAAEQAAREQAEHEARAAEVEAGEKRRALLSWKQSGGSEAAFEAAWPEIWKQRLVERTVQAEALRQRRALNTVRNV